MSKCGTCGYEWAQGRDGSHRCSDTMQKTIDALRNPWVSVDDRLPDIDQEVLIQIPVCSHVNVESAKYLGCGTFLGCWIDRRGPHCAYKVTHWMEIPVHEK